MIFYKSLFVGNSVDNKSEIIKFINDNTPVFNIYFICVEKSSKNLMEIIETKELFKPHNKNKKYIVIGIANGKKEAFKLSTDIILWWINKNKGFDKFKAFFN